MLYTLAAAAKASGLGVSAIRAAIERGQITAIRDLFDEWQVEDTELHRLYFPVGHATATGDAGSTNSPLRETTLMTGSRAEQREHAHSGDREEPGSDPSAQVDPSLGVETASTGASSLVVRERPKSAAPFLGQPENAENGSASNRFALHRLDSVEEASGSGWHGNEDAQYRFCTFDHSNRIDIENTLFWDSHIKISEQDLERDSKILSTAGRPKIVLAAALLVGLALGWIGGLASYHFFSRGSAFLRQQTHSYSPAPTENKFAAADKGRRDQSAGELVTGKAPVQAVTENRVRRRYSANPSIAQPPELRPRANPTARQNSTEPAVDDSAEWSPAGIAQATNSPPRRTPVPETKPTTIEGWTVRSVFNGTAVLEGPGGIWTAARGDTVPGLGRVDSIVLWGSRWIVATSRGLVTTP